MFHPSPRPSRCCALLGAALCATASLSAQAPDQLLRAKRIVLAPDTVLEPGALLIRAGKVAYAGDGIPAEAIAKAERVDFGTATITPGFVLSYATLGQDQNLGELAFSLTPDLQVAEGVDLWHKELSKLPGSGVTAAAMAPSERQLVGGIAALLKPGADGASIGDADLPLHMSLTPNALSQDRPPTSLMGALDLTRTAWRDAAAGVRTGADMAVLRQTLDGSRKLFVRADARREIFAALNFAREFGLQLTIVGAAEAKDAITRLAEQKVGVVLGTLTAEAKLELLELPAALARAGVPFAFSGQAEQLRLSAALAVKHGLDRRTALAALTRTPAQLLGSAATSGSLREGSAADFAVWSGDPIDLASRHLSTWIGGARQFAATTATQPGVK